MIWKREGYLKAPRTRTKYRFDCVHERLFTSASTGLTCFRYFTPYILESAILLQSGRQYNLIYRNLLVNLSIEVFIVRTDPGGYSCIFGSPDNYSH
jgi:hypothetical protein